MDKRRLILYRKKNLHPRRMVMGEPTDAPLLSFGSDLLPRMQPLTITAAP